MRDLPVVDPERCVRVAIMERRLEALAASVVVADASDPEAVAGVCKLLHDLGSQLPQGSLGQELAACEKDLEEAAGGHGDVAAVLDKISALVSGIQKAGAAERDQMIDDPKLLEEFFCGQREANEQLEADLLALERGDAGGIASIRRRVHTLKGESGALGLADLARVYHAIEDFLEAHSDLAASAGVIAGTLLSVKDWIVRFDAAFTRGEAPPAVEEALQRLVVAPQPSVAVAAAAAPTPVDSGREAAGPERSREPELPVSLDAPSAPRNAEPPRPQVTEPTPEPARTNAAAPAPPKAPEASAASAGATTRDREKVLERTEDTIALLTEFLLESEEGLSNADQILMKAERSGPGPQDVRGLFAVFHTIKGIAGFLELTSITELAHVTESLLAKCRDGQMSLSGGVLDRVFDATSMMRRLLGDVKEALQRRMAVPASSEAAALSQRIKATTERGQASGRPQGAPSVRARRSIAGPRPSRSAGAGGQPEADGGRASRRVTGATAAGGSAMAGGGAPADGGAGANGAAPPGAEGPGLKLRETVKVDVERVDGLIEMIGELVIAESMVTNAPEITSIASPRLRNALAQLGKVTRDLQDVGLRMRMVPLQSLFRKMARLVRDLGHKTGKALRMDIAGESTEMDRSMVEQIADPLLHLIRNAVDHGIESAEQREAAGKSGTGTIRLAAYHEGGSVVIEIADDGKGLDRDAILAKARHLGIVSQPTDPPDHEIYSLIFAPGFSTAAAVTEISGRGVGMDVVKRNIEALRGRVLIQTERGKGTTFKLVMPLTLAIIDGMLVACGSERYIIPTLSIVESVKPTASMLLTLGGRAELLNLRGRVLTLQRLDRLFEIEGAKQDATEQLVVVVESSTGTIGLLVDDVLTQQHVVIKSLGTAIGSTPFSSGAAILSDGRIGLILNVEDLCQAVVGKTALGGRGVSPSAVSDIEPRPRPQAHP